MSNRPSDENQTQQSGERLQKVLAHAGVASRRKAEDLIAAGRVSIDGKVVTELGTRVDPKHASIAVDGQPVHIETDRYIMLNKPSGYITTMQDERGRRTVMELVDVRERVVPVGRLDRPTEGLLLMTNDGELANRIMHPRYEIEKVYDAELDGVPPPRVLDLIQRGVTVDGERTVPTSLKPLRQTEFGTLVRIGLHEGRNRIVRRIFDSVDYPVVKLTRVRVGPLQLGTLKRGAWRDLRESELEQLRDAVGLNEPPPPQREERPKRYFPQPRRDNDRKRGRS